MLWFYSLPITVRRILVNLFPAPQFEINPASLDFRSSDTTTFKIQNLGTLDLDWTVTKLPDWVKGLRGSSSKIDGGGEITIDLYVDPAKMQRGNNEGEIIISAQLDGQPKSESTSQTIEVKVFLATPPNLAPKITAVTGNSIIIETSINERSSTAIVQHGHIRSLSPTFKTANFQTELGNLGDDVPKFSTQFTNLKPQTVYYVRAYATTTDGTYYSKAIEVATATLGIPTDIQLSNQTIREKQPLATFIGRFTTTDDPGDKHTYSLVSGSGSGGNINFYSLAGQP